MRIRVTRSLVLSAATLASIGMLIPSLAAARPTSQTRGVLFEVDLESYELRVALNGTAGPRFRVAAGSPSHPTPRGTFALEKWIGNPTFTPGPEARSRGARAATASRRGPLGFAKVPFQGSFQLHGGAHQFAVGKPVTLGCVQLTNEQMRELESWLSERGALTGGVRTAGGEIHHRFARPTTLIVH